MDIIDVQTTAHLESLIPEWLTVPAVALDTEFFRERTYFPIGGLIQLSIGEAVCLIDPIAIEDLSPLRRLFEAPVVKVLHSVSEDLEVFQRLLGVVPAPLADTQVGAALVGFRYGIGYQGLIEELLGETVEKGETRSDWLRRPLSDSQRHYAAMDVAWLLPAYRELSERVRRRGREDWWAEESARTVLDASQLPRPEDSWRRLKGAARLQPRELAALQGICAWREQEARSTDVPRGHVIKDAVCLEIARRCPRDLAALSDCEGMTPRLAKQLSGPLLEAVSAARALAPGCCPVAPAVLSRAEATQLQELRKLVEHRAVELEVAPELLARRRDLEALLRDRQLPPVLQGWRRDQIGDALMGVVTSNLSSDQGGEPDA